MQCNVRCGETEKDTTWLKKNSCFNLNVPFFELCVVLSIVMGKKCQFKKWSLDLYSSTSIVRPPFLHWNCGLTTRLVSLEWYYFVRPPFLHWNCGLTTRLVSLEWYFYHLRAHETWHGKRDDLYLEWPYIKDEDYCCPNQTDYFP